MIFPHFFPDTFKKINRVLAHGLNEREGMDLFAVSVIRDGESVLVCSSKYATRISLDGLSFENFMFAQKQPDGKTFYGACSYFFIVDDQLYAMNIGLSIH